MDKYRLITLASEAVNIALDFGGEAEEAIQGIEKTYAMEFTDFERRIILYRAKDIERDVSTYDGVAKYSLPKRDH